MLDKSKFLCEHCGIQIPYPTNFQVKSDDQLFCFCSEYCLDRWIMQISNSLRYKQNHFKRQLKTSRGKKHD